MAYDAARELTVLFGGSSLAAPLGDTWLWGGLAWAQAEDIGPAPRLRHALAFDSARQRIVLFGGEAAGGALLGDTWEWDGDAWAQVQDVGPTARRAHALAFDSVAERVVLFGGEGPAGQLLHDTWEWSGADWVEVEDIGPSPRRGHSMTFDRMRERVVLFGGEGPVGTSLRDTWGWRDATWVQLQDIGPGASAQGAAVFDGAAAILFGGIDADDRIFRDTWSMDGARWTQRQNMGPPARWGHAMVFDGARARTVLFGGLAVAPDAAVAVDSLLADTWELDSGADGNGGGGPGPDAGLTIAELSAPPRVFPGNPIEVTVTLSGQAPVEPPEGVAVAVSIAGAPLGELLVAPGRTSATAELPTIELELGDYELGARVLPDGEPVARPLRLGVPDGIAIASAAFDPPDVPGAGGGVSKLTVALSGGTPETVRVDLSLRAARNGVLVFPEGSSEATLDFPVPAGTPAGDLVVRATLGDSHVEATLVIS
jgi:hypothetical protein